MKKLLAFAALFAVVALTSCKYDDDDLWNSVHGLENRVAKLEELCKQMNTNISSLQTIVTALQNNVYVTGTTPLMKDGKEIGYTITFSKGNPITIYHGKDGQDGEDGITPTISVKKDTDGVYYWTLNGEFIVVDGGKIQAEGKDGTNGTTPQFKIENDYWFVSYNNGANWTQLGKATGEDGIGGDSMFSGVDYETSTDYVIFTLSNGTQIKLPTWSAFEALQRLCNETNTNLSALQTIVTALQNNDYITSVDPLTENGKVVGYTIKFAKSNPIVIYNGKDGADGVDGNTPVIGVKKDTDGIYYWTLDGEWLTDEKGNKVKAQGTDGKDGVDGEDGTNGKDGITPQLKIENGRWMLSMDNGKTWTDIGQATGADGTDGEDGVDGKDGTNGIFKSVTEDNDNVYFTLEDDSVITIPKSDNSKFAIAFDTTDIAILNGGESKTISYTITDATKNTVVKAIAQDGWKVKVDATSTDKGTITITAPNPIVESEILVFANDGSYRTVMVSLNCMQGQINIADNSINATSAGGTQEIKLTTNLDYTIEIPEDAQSWLSLAPETRALREDTIVFEVTANEGMQRYTTVALKDEQGKILQTIIFRQLGTCTEVHVETKGELENELAGYDYANIESLKITGVLNDVDFLFIYRMMPNLKNLDIAEVNITALPIQAFYKSTNVENLILPNTLITIGEEMFYQSKLKTVVIPANATTIGNSAFEQCASLISIDIPANVETIGTAVFWGCSSLTTVTFEKGSQLKTIGGGSYSSGAFSDCTALTSIEIPASVETIEAAAFKDCSSLTSIEIPASVETIKASAFKGCSSLATVTFENGSQLKTIEGGYPSSGTFADCTALTSIEIPASVETIEAAAFKGCSSLATVTFEKGSQLKTIGGGGSSYYGAFGQLKNLMTVDMSACTQVKTIGESAFDGDSELRLFKIGTETPPTCGRDAFSGINPYSVLKVPSGCADIYKVATEWERFASITGLDE